MSKRQAQLIVLCEDQQQEVFARHFFIERGFHRRKIRSKICPKGRDAGEQYVRERYPLEVQANRTKSYLDIYLAVVIDADTNSVDHRLNQLDENVTRQSNERIAIFVPSEILKRGYIIFGDEKLMK